MFRLTRVSDVCTACPCTTPVSLACHWLGDSSASQTLLGYQQPARTGLIILLQKRRTASRAARRRDWCNQVSCHKEVPGSRSLKRSTETMAMIAIFVRIICWNVLDSRAVLASRYRHQLGPFLYILWAVLVDMGRFGSWSGPFWRSAVFVHSP